MACEHGPVSWDEAFADGYGEWSAHMTADVAFYVELARRADGPLVELAVGNGRVAIPVAQATGQRVIGIDSSPAMLRQARARAAETGVELDLREGDMRDLVLGEPAGLIYCPFRALLDLPAWADRRRTFERVAVSLRLGGCRARIHDRGGDLRLRVAAWGRQAATWYSCVSPPRTCFRRIRCSARLICGGRV
jgi:SAM-dependent methyltransferase